MALSFYGHSIRIDNTITESKLTFVVLLESINTELVVSIHSLTRTHTQPIQIAVALLGTPLKGAAAHCVAA